MADDGTFPGSRPDANQAAASTPGDAAAGGPGRFARARRRVVLWDAGYCALSAVVLLVLWAAGRSIDNVPDVALLIAGVAVIVWAGALVGIAANGVGRTQTLVVGVVNIIAGGVTFALGWVNDAIPVLAMVLAAQVIGFGVVQWVTSVRR